MLDQLNKFNLDEIMYYENIKQYLDQIESICSPFPEFQQTMLRSINTLQLYIANKLIEFPIQESMNLELKTYIFDRQILELKGKEINGEISSEQVYNGMIELFQKNDK